jgi:hypothetical protein
MAPWICAKASESAPASVAVARGVLSRVHKLLHSRSGVTDVHRAIGGDGEIMSPKELAVVKAIATESSDHRSVLADHDDGGPVGFIERDVAAVSDERRAIARDGYVEWTTVGRTLQRLLMPRRK